MGKEMGEGEGKEEEEEEIEKKKFHLLSDVFWAFTNWAGGNFLEHFITNP